MKRLLVQLVVVGSCLTAIALLADLQPLVNGGSRVQNDPPIKISAPRYRWLRISNQPATEFNLPGQRIKTAGMAMLRDEINIFYERGNYGQDKAKLVTEVTIANNDGKLTSYQAGIEREIKTATGELWAVLGRLRHKRVGPWRDEDLPDRKQKEGKNNQQHTFDPRRCRCRSREEARIRTRALAGARAAKPVSIDHYQEELCRIESLF